MEITVRDLWNVLKRAFVLMIVCALVLAIGMGIYTSKFVQKVYTSSVDYVLLVKEGNSNLTEKGTVESLNNALVVGAKAIPTLSSYLITETMMENVLRYVADMHALEPENPDYILEHTYTAGALKRALTFTLPEEETDLVFSVSCRAFSAHDSRVILNALGAVINERAANVVRDIFYIEACDPPKDGTLTSPNLTRNVMLAGAIGALIPYAVFLVI